jgi:sulfur-oxidizing protein SoxZ
MTTRAIVTVPRQARAGEVIELRALIAHPMETGYRVDSEGRAAPRDIIRRFECRWNGELVFAADLHAAIAANPYVAFHLVAQSSGTVSFHWTGDRGFAHSEHAEISVA